MGFLAGKRILLTGLLSNRSIAYGVAQAVVREGGSLALTYVGERFRDRIEGFAKEFNTDLMFDCDVSSDEQIDATFAGLAQHWDSLDGIVHSIGFAPRESISGDFLEGLSREGFRVAHDISAYSFPAMTKAALPLLLKAVEKGGSPSALTLSYLGSTRVVPHYNTMGLAKASLEASVRYLADALGPRGIRANAVSAGAIKTLAASGIADFGKMLKFNELNSPLRRNVSIENVGNAVAFMLSDLAAGITGDVLFVDGGMHAVVGGMATIE